MVDPAELATQAYTLAWDEHHPDEDTTAMWSCVQCDMVVQALLALWMES